MEKTFKIGLGICLVASVAAYLGVGYFIPRTDFSLLLLSYALAFGSYLWLLKSPLSTKNILFLAILFRSLLFFSYPALSDDYFRFIWDGTLLIHGENPFLHLPSFYITAPAASIPGITEELYSKLNSPFYYTVYPPICQFIFALARLAGGEQLLINCLVMRIFIIAAEIGTMLILGKLLHLWQLPPQRISLYALNPLVILELTGNLHFEALLIFFLLLSIYLGIKNKYALSAMVFGLAVAVKLWPLMLLPFLLKLLGFKKFSQYLAIVAAVLMLLFAPFLSWQLFQNISTSLNLHFQKFEFNASVYYVLRWIGYYGSGYNQIALLGRLLSGITFILILVLAFKARTITIAQLPAYYLLAVSIYLFLATIVHPWYITPLIAFMAATRWRYPLYWSGVVIFSYAAYRSSSYQENLYLVALEYLVVYGVFFYELYRSPKVFGKEIKSMNS